MIAFFIEVVPNRVHHTVAVVQRRLRVTSSHVHLVNNPIQYYDKHE